MHAPRCRRDDKNARSCQLLAGAQTLHIVIRLQSAILSTACCAYCWHVQILSSRSINQSVNNFTVRLQVDQLPT